MYAPDDDDPAGYAKERGFGAVRELGAGWTLLGSIRDRDKSDAQWR